MLLHKQCVSIRIVFTDGSTSMGEVILFPIGKNKKLQKELLFAQELRCPECNKLKEDDWFITYNNGTYICVDCSYERGENEHET